LTRFFVQYSPGLLWTSVLNYGLGKDTSVCYLDGTEWRIGKFNLHCLVLAFDHQGVPIPIYLRLYKHKGVLSDIYSSQTAPLVDKFLANNL
jgi:hypothetical protein